jgi:hypothetical protein
MMSMKSTRLARNLLVVLAAAAALASAQTAPDGTAPKKKIEKRVVVRCDADSCPDAATAHKVIVIDRDGEEGGKSFTWHGTSAGADAGHLMFIGEDGLDQAQGASWIGLTPELRRHFGVPTDSGVMVSGVKPDSPAAKAGLRVGDIVSTADGHKVASPGQLERALARHAGEAVPLDLWRDGKAQTLSLTPAEEPHRKLSKVIELQCDGSDEQDCSADWVGESSDVCDQQEDCNVNVTCNDGDCECTVNGEGVDCARLGETGRK